MNIQNFIFNKIVNVSTTNDYFNLFLYLPHVLIIKVIIYPSKLNNYSIFNLNKENQTLSLNETVFNQFSTGTLNDKHYPHYDKNSEFHFKLVNTKSLLDYEAIIKKNFEALKSIKLINFECNIFKIILDYCLNPGFIFIYVKEAIHDSNHNDYDNEPHLSLSHDVTHIDLINNEYNNDNMDSDIEIIDINHNSVNNICVNEMNQTGLYV